MQCTEILAKHYLKPTLTINSREFGLCSRPFNPEAMIICTYHGSGGTEVVSTQGVQYFGESLDGVMADTSITLSILLNQTQSENLHFLLWDLFFQKQCILLIKPSYQSFSDQKFFLSCSYRLRIDLHFKICLNTQTFLLELQQMGRCC